MSTLREVALVNEGGNIIGHKPRGVLEPKDIPHSVFVLLVTPERELVLSRIKGNRLSATAVTMCETDESPGDAAQRALNKPTQILHHLGDQFFAAPSGRKIYMSVFYGITHIYESNDTCEILSADSLDERLKDCTPALVFAWNSYKHLLPL